MYLEILSTFPVQKIYKFTLKNYSIVEIFKKMLFFITYNINILCIIHSFLYFLNKTRFFDKILFTSCYLLSDKKFQFFFILQLIL